MVAILGKLFNITALVRMRFYPMLNRALLKNKGAILGRNIQIPGKLNLVTSGNNVIGIGNNFYFSSGDAVNPISSNLQGAIYLENGASLKIGNNVGMSSTRMWIRESVTIGDNVKIGGCVLITDTDAHPLDYLSRRTGNEGTKSAPVVIEGRCLDWRSYCYSKGCDHRCSECHRCRQCGYKKHSRRLCRSREPV